MDRFDSLNLPKACARCSRPRPCVVVVTLALEAPASFALSGNRWWLEVLPLRNLVDNALRYSPEGGRRWCPRMRPRAARGGR